MTAFESADLLDPTHYIQQQVSLPPQPSILVQIRLLTEQIDATNLHTIAELIARDISLTAGLFRVANSAAARGLAAPLSSVDQAISVLGLKQVLNLVKALSLRKAVGGTAPFYLHFWERSDDLALLATLVARRYVAMQVSFEQAYMAGLFMDCGVPLLIERFPNYCEAFQLSDGMSWPNLQAEDHQFHTDHRVVAYLVARHWHLPDLVCEAIRDRGAMCVPDSEHAPLVACLQFARHVYHHSKHLADYEWPDFSHAALAALDIPIGLEQEHIDDIAESFRLSI